MLPGCIPRQHCWPATLLSCKQHRQDWQGSSSQLPAELLLSWEDGAGWSGHWAWAASWLCQEVPAEFQACVGNEFRSQRRPFCRTVHRRHCKGEFMAFFYSCYLRPFLEVKLMISWFALLDREGHVRCQPWPHTNPRAHPHHDWPGELLLPGGCL